LYKVKDSYQKLVILTQKISTQKEEENTLRDQNINMSVIIVLNS